MLIPHSFKEIHTHLKNREKNIKEIKQKSCQFVGHLYIVENSFKFLHDLF